MIYFDNAATTWPKPDRVYRGVYEFMKSCAANPGRGGHRMARRSSDIVYTCREMLAEFIGVNDPSSVIFTKNATEALNTVIHGVMSSGGHAVCTSMEHNSVLRPLEDLARRGIISYDMVWGNSEGFVTADDIIRRVRADTKLIVVNHVSNVCGSIQDISEIGAEAHKRGILFLADGAQSGGVINYNMDNIDFLALAGHKGLYGPMGTGVLCVNTDAYIAPLTQGGTGSYSSVLTQPDELPDRLESGTLNAVGIAGLLEGIKFLRVVGMEDILHHERELARYFIEGLSVIPNTVLYGTTDISKRTGVVAFNRTDIDCVTLAAVLSDKYDIASRAGLHCAYNAHRTIGSGDDGAVRFAFGRFNTRDEVSKALLAISRA